MVKKKVQFECKRCHLTIEAANEPEDRLCSVCRNYIDLDKEILSNPDQLLRKAYFDSARKSRHFRKKKAQKKKEEKIPQTKIDGYL